MKTAMITNLREERSPWNVPCHECRSWAYVLGADTRSALDRALGAGRGRTNALPAPVRSST